MASRGGTNNFVLGTDIVLTKYLTRTFIMNIKRTFGTILTILGVIGLIYAGYGFTQHEAANRQLIVFGIIGAIFFFTGVGLVKNTKDEA